MNKYEGSLLLVSHDRYFISKTANKIWEIIDGKIKEFKGGYEEYVAWKERMARNTENIKKEKEQPKIEKPKTDIKKTEAPPPVSNNHAPINKEAKKELQKHQRNFQLLEEKISLLNEEKKKLESSLADPVIYTQKDSFLKAEEEYKSATNELEKLNTAYEKAFEKIMELESKITT